MPVLYTPHFVQFFDDDGAPLAGGLLYSYAAGTTTPKATYTTAAGDIENANPVVLDAYGRAVIFISGAYKFVLQDSDGVTIETTDNVTAFNITSETTEGFYESFSGDGIETDFTLSENLGSDENALMIFTELEATTNGTFASDTGWTKGTGWSIGSGVATATGAISTDLEQTAGITLIDGKTYSCTFTITRSAGDITLSVGGTDGTVRNASGTYTENIVCGSTQAIKFATSGFTGTVDNVSIKEIGGVQIIPPTKYTVSGTSLSISTPIATGSNNLMVYAPYTLINAAGAAQTAADEAIAAQAAAELAENNIAGLEATSTTSLAVGTGSKAFTIDAGKGFIAGMWVLATSDADPTNYMHGYVDSYASTTLTVEVTNVGGSGTLADWTIRLSGTRGAQGAAGTVSGASSATAATNDKVLLLDTDDSDALIYDTVENIVGLAVGRLIEVQVFSSSDTWTAPAGANSLEVFVIAGGGAAGNAGSASAAGGAGGGGGGGEFAYALLTSGWGATETITIGAGGAISGSAGGNGSAGGTSSFGALLTAIGGSGGTGSGANGSAAGTAAGGAGGTGGTGADISVQGGDGTMACWHYGSGFGIAGDGGDSKYGFGGSGAKQAVTGSGPNSQSGTAANGYGGGGGGSVAHGNVDVNSGAGAGGLIIVKAYA